MRPTGRTDPRTGEPRMARIRPPQGGFRDDPYSALVFALEEFEPIGQRAAKAAIFTRRVVAPRVPRLGADTPADALAICLDTYGEARPGEIARLLGTTEDDARGQLGMLVFDEPGTGRLVPAAEYLSGNVREKLAAAERAAADDPRYQPNTSALREVMPADLTPGEIEARLGAAWSGAAYVEQFLREIIEDPTVEVEHPRRRKKPGASRHTRLQSGHLHQRPAAGAYRGRMGPHAPGQHPRHVLLRPGFRGPDGRARLGLPDHDLFGFRTSG